MSGLRATVIVLVLLAGGAVVSVAVAWACAIWSQPTPAMTGPDVPDWPIPVRQAWGEPVHYWESVGTGARLEHWNNLRLDVFPSNWPGDSTGSVTVHSFGWPARGMRWIEVSAAKGAELARPGVVVPWLSDLGGSSVPIKFPIDVVPAPFGVNTLAYACVLAAPVAAWRVVARRRRRQLGLCVTCGYDVRRLGVCPECGLPVVRDAGVGA